MIFWKKLKLQAAALTPLLLLLLLLQLQISTTQAARFAVNGPVLTVTLKDSGSDTATNNNNDHHTHLQGALAESFSDQKAWSAMDLTSLRPNLFWSIQSLSPPLPNWLPSWTSFRTNVGYRYDELKRLPSFVEADLKFRSDRLKAELQVQPSYELKAKRANVLLQISQGASHVLARFSKSANSNNAQDKSSSSSSGDYSQNNSPASRSCLEFLRASYNFQFPGSASVSSVRITPSLDVTKQEPSCVIEGVTGGSGRTKAVLKLNYDNPTLAMMHALDERNTIAPEISLYSAKIIYQWNINLPGSSIRTRVDPTSAIDVTWTDTSAADGGRWVTDFRLPLEGTTIRALASDVRVRRQFNF